MRIDYKKNGAKTPLAMLVFAVMHMIPKSWSEFFWYGSVTVIDDVIYLPLGATQTPESFEKTVTYRHEMVHVAQRERHHFWQTRYVLSPAFRLEAEAEAYALAQVQEGAMTVAQAVAVIHANYVPLWYDSAFIYDRVLKALNLGGVR